MIGPGSTAQLSLAPCPGFGGLAIGGGENKSEDGGDFTVAINTIDPSLFQKYCQEHGSAESQSNSSVTENQQGQTGEDVVAADAVLQSSGKKNRSAPNAILPASIMSSLLGSDF